MVNKELIDWIKSEEAQGYSEQELRAALSKQGYSKKEIDDALKATKKSALKKVWILAIVIVILLSFAISTYYRGTFKEPSQIQRATCSPSYECVFDGSVYTDENCTKVSNYCQYGCNANDGKCNPPPPPATCAHSAKCVGNDLQLTDENCLTEIRTCPNGCDSAALTCKPTISSEVRCNQQQLCLNASTSIQIYPDCTNTTTHCPNGCEGQTGKCRASPLTSSSCTPKNTCVFGASRYIYPDCSSTDTSCQFECNQFTGLCSSSSCRYTCTDSDGGKDTNVRGNVTSYDCNNRETKFDECGAGSYANYVWEQYCDYGPQMELIACPSGKNCVSGRCQ